MIGMSIPFWLIGAAFFVVGLFSAYGSAMAIDTRLTSRDAQAPYKPMARFFIWCMLFAAAFFYGAAVIATRGL